MPNNYPDGQFMGTMHIMDQQESEGENHNESLEELVTHSDDGL
jgi:hypothetical protein